MNVLNQVLRMLREKQVSFFFFPQNLTAYWQCAGHPSAPVEKDVFICTNDSSPTLGPLGYG